MSLSVGIAQTGPVEYVTPGALIHQADRRMLAAKTASQKRAERSLRVAPAKIVA